MITSVLSTILLLQQPVRPDVIVVMIDDVADSDIDAVQAKGWLPNITSLANSGVRYRRAYAHAKCHPTRDSMLYGITLGIDRGDSCAPPTSVTHQTKDYSMVEMFDGAGYNTLHVGKWHVGNNLHGDWKITTETVGFDNCRNGVHIGPTCNIPGSNQQRVDDGVYSTTLVHNTLGCRDAFLDWWLSTPSPKFAMVNFSDAHAPFHYPPPELLPSGYPQCGVPCTNREEYEAEIVGVDTALGDMMTVAPGAYFVFLGDNGTPGNVPGEPATKTDATRPNQDPNRVKLTCYEDGVRIPLIISGPGIHVKESNALVHVSDVFPTLARVANIQPYPDALLKGKSFAGTLVGGTGSRDHLFVWNNPPSLDKALIERDWKLLTRTDGVEELYNLALDPLELSPLPLTGPDYLRLKLKQDLILAGG